eukprot:2293802-Rhodomonas_salina.1
MRIILCVSSYAYPMPKPPTYALRPILLRATLAVAASTTGTEYGMVLPDNSSLRATARGEKRLSEDVNET